jgi:hypothetical protein
VNFLPAMSTKAKKAKGQQIRAWHLNRQSGTDLSGIARAINALRVVLPRIAHRPVSRSVGHAESQTATEQTNQGGDTWLAAVRQHQPRLFAHWYLLAHTTTDLWGPDEARVSGPVLRERQGRFLPSLTSSARRDLSGGAPARAVPTATAEIQAKAGEGVEDLE